jgi:abortive infection bacteriophage resistance protein
MDNPSFNKQPLTYQAQIDLLKARSLSIPNESKALFLLQNISFFRLKSYCYPFLKDKDNKIFKEDATFDKIFKLYCYDRELRKLILGELEKIEVAIRSKLIYSLSHKHGPHWYSKWELFIDAPKYIHTIDHVMNEYERTDDLLVHKFKKSYQRDSPPCWIFLEISSLGQLSNLYSNLKPSQEKREIAHYFGLDDSTFASWLHTIVYIRNVCAHHARLWNRVMRILPQKPQNPKNDWIRDHQLDNKKLFFVLSMIMYLIKIINPKNTFKKKIKDLHTEYTSIDFKAMGFPDNWEAEPVWA